MNELTTLIRQAVRPMAPIPTGIQSDLAKTCPVSAMIFDVYGTLLISGAGEPAGIQPSDSKARDREIALVLARHGIADSPARIQQRLTMAIQEAHQRAQAQGVDCPEVDIPEIWRSITGIQEMERLKSLSLAFELTVNPVYAMPGARELTCACQTARVPMGIVSNAQFYTPLLLEWFFEADLFDDRLCFYSFREGRAKPSPAMFERAARALGDMGIKAGKTLFIGNDMLNDILPAAAVGFKTALFAGDRRSLRMREADGRVKEIVPDLILTELRQLIPATEP